MGGGGGMLGDTAVYSIRLMVGLNGQTTLMMITMTVVWFYNLTEILFSRTDVYEISGVEILLQIWSLESINATKGTQTKH